MLPLTMAPEPAKLLAVRLSTRHCRCPVRQPHDSSLSLCRQSASLLVTAAVQAVSLRIRHCRCVGFSSVLDVVAVQAVSLRPRHCRCAGRQLKNLSLSLCRPSASVLVTVVVQAASLRIRHCRCAGRQDPPPHHSGTPCRCLPGRPGPNTRSKIIGIKH